MTIPLSREDATKCMQCNFHTMSYGTVLCTVSGTRPAGFQRHHLSVCGPEAKCFEQKTKRTYAEYDE